MEKVEGLVGSSFCAKDPTALALWYHDMLGVSLVPTGLDTPPWVSIGGVTVFAPFASDTD